MTVAALKTWTGAAICVAALALAGGEVRGQATRPAATRPVEISFDTTAEAYAALNDSEWVHRDAAQRYLMTQPPDELAVVEKNLMKTKDPEVEARLYAVALHLYLKGDTPFVGEVGLLGVSLSPEELDEDGEGNLQVAIAITSLQPGFPAAEVLRIGDRIFALNGTKFNDGTNIDSFRSAVNLNRPGTSVKLTILRDGVMRDVRVKLAGVPQAGSDALMEFIQTRNVKAATYLQMLHAKKDGMPISQRSGAV